MNAVRVLIACLMIVGGAVAHAADTTKSRGVTFRTRTMGTWGAVTLTTADSAAVADAAYQGLLAFHHADSLMSNWTTTSDVARINREAATRETTVHPEVATVLKTALAVTHESEGAFDVTVEPLVRLWGFLGGKPRVPADADIVAIMPRVGSRHLTFDAARATVRFDQPGVGIDFGGIAKGYGADLAAATLLHAGIHHALVDLSGNMRAMGSAAGHQGWIVGVRDPAGILPWLVRIQLVDEGISTSGNYEQFVTADGRRLGHILDPRTGFSAGGLTSVTVVAKSAMLADAWSTALFVLGPMKARALAAQRDDLAVVILEPGRTGIDTLWIESSLRDRVETAPGLPKNLVVRTF